MAYKVLFVCTGNICRSPTAEGALRKALAKQGLEGMIIVDSAGTHDYHVGEAPDTRSIAAAKRRQIDISAIRARQLTQQDFFNFNLLLALDKGHLRQLQALCPPNAVAQHALLLDYAGIGMEDVPDPYYKGEEAFEHTLNLIEAAMPPMIEKLRNFI